jgi:Cof subfamily protein (haloacid dehalogenase superfamily)
MTTRVTGTPELTSLLPSSTARLLPPQLIATDLDGTFLSPDGTVSPENAAAVLAAQAAGIPVVFATGRPVRWLGVIKDLPGGHPTVIASNGAVLYDLGADSVIDRICIDPQVALAAVLKIRARVPGTAFAFESGLRFGHEASYRLLSAAAPDSAKPDPAIFSGPAEEIAHTCEFVKMLVQSVDVAPDTLLDQVRECVGSALTATHSATRDIGLVEISAPGVSKASMLRRCCDRLGIGADRVAAFGDMPNDVDMLSWVGMPHVVANAHAQLLNGDYSVVPGNAESGVGRTIRRLIERADR